MIKGAQKRMIVIRTADSSIFEEAYFVVRGGETRESGDMIAEANRIISESGASCRAPRRSLRTAASILGAALIGAGVTLCVCLLVLS